MFAKLYETDLGQLLVMRAAADDGVPGVRLFFVPAGFGLCSVTAKFEDSEAGVDAADRFFDGMTRNRAINWAGKIIDGVTAKISQEGGADEG